MIFLRIHKDVLKIAKTDVVYLFRFTQIYFELFQSNAIYLLVVKLF